MAAVLVVMGLVACDDEQATTSCTTSIECMTDDGTGTVCTDSRCTPCETAAACEADYGFGASCVEGVCQPCTPGSIACGCAEGECSSGECIDDACVDCQAGDVDCVCLEGDACAVGGRCDEGLCVDCPPGELECPCDDGDTCQGELVCMTGLCVPDDCELGQLDCPCGEDDFCEDDLYCTDGALCHECTSDIEGCACDAQNQCGSDLVCDIASDSCRQPLGCTEIVCGEHQLCESAQGRDSTCIEDCEPGWAWDPAADACIEAPEANCTLGAPGSIASECSADNRACDDSGAGASCGDCIGGYTDEGGTLATCRRVATCEAIDATCKGANRSCTPHAGTTDATCGACLTGFAETAGVCVPAPTATCEPAGADSILAECNDRNRLCRVLPTGAVCGVCQPGYAPNPESEACAEPVLCADLDCALDGRTCFNEPVARCGDCVEGLKPEDPEDPESACVIALGCDDVTCESDQVCVPPQNGLDAQCIDWPCELAPGVPDFHSALRLDTGACEPCGVCTGEGLTGRIWPFTLERSNTCICETLDGYYYDLIGSTGRLCDADGDGWLNRDAQPSIETTDAALRNNARCDVRTVDRVTLQNEYEQRLDVLLCEGATVPLFDGPESTSCAFEGFEPLDLTLFESVRNDVQERLDAQSDVDVPPYGDRRLRAEELNSVTRACVSATGDFNDNGLPDLSEWQEMEADGLDLAEATWLEFGHFAELHRTFFEPIPGSIFGRLVIAEKSRCEDGFPFDYSDPSRSQYWRGCGRNRHASYDGTSEEMLTTFDFARFACEDLTGHCILPGPPPLDPEADSDFDETPDVSDCGPRDASIYPGAEEACNGLDDNCDGKIDEGTNTCPCPVVNYRGHSYLLCEQPTGDDLDYAEANAFCEALGATLISVDSFAEQSFVFERMASRFGTTAASVWIGYDDLALEGTFAWTCGSTATYTNWGVSEPNGGTTESCTETAINYPFPPRWNDVSCDARLRYVACEFGCNDPQGQSADIRAHGLCDLPTLPPPNDLWRGMMHHSQFQCSVADDDTLDGPHEVDPLDLYDGIDDGPYTFNRCIIDCTPGDPECTETSVPPNAEHDPWEAALSCEVVLGDEVADDSVGWVAVRYLGDEVHAPERGCLDEWLDWPQLCPGYAGTDSVVGIGALNDFGNLRCGCGFRWGGPECNLGCPDDAAHWDPNYDPLTRTGTWMCGGPVATDYLELDPVEGPAGTGAGYTLRGEIPLEHTPSTVQCEGDDCSCAASGTCTGYVIRQPWLR